MYEIHDYKTSRRLPMQATIDRDRQLALYQMAVHQMMADARSQHAVAALESGEILVLGGRQTDSSIGSAEVFSPAREP